MNPKPILFGVIFVLLCVVGITLAQDSTCELNNTEVVTVVSNICSSVGDNQVCYGNLEVNLIPQQNTTTLNFSTPGDLADLNNVRSLFLSRLNLSEDTWGIAEMRLVVQTVQGAQEVTLLLFGDVQVDNEVGEQDTIVMMSNTYTNVRSAPTDEAVVMTSLVPDETLDAVGRLEDSTWLRVRMPDGAVGWVLTSLVTPVSDDADIETLPVQNVSDPYFGAMQAMTLNTGNNTCGDFYTDGLIIQTPRGTARVTMRINEVTVEFIPSTNLGATAFVQANPEDGMTVNMIDGSAFVGANGTSYFVNGGTKTTINLNENSEAVGIPTYPEAADDTIIGDIPIMGTVRDPEIPITVDTGGTANATDQTGTSSETSTNIVTDGVSTGGSNTSGSTGDTGGSTSDSGDSSSDSGSDTSNNGIGSDRGCGTPGNACNAPGHADD